MLMIGPHVEVEPSLPPRDASESPIGVRVKPATIDWPGSRAEILYLRFKRNIIERTWLPGDLLNIDRLATECGVSITPVREALARLTADKLVVTLPNKGCRVAPPPTAERFADLARVRLLLEPFAAREAALRVTARDHADLRRIQERIADLGTSGTFEEIQAFTTLNRAFHELVFRLSGNAVLVDLYEQLAYHVVIGHHHHVYGMLDLPLVVAEHAAIVEALVRRDPVAAEAAMRVHVDIGSQRIFAAYAESPREAAAPADPSPAVRLSADHAVAGAVRRSSRRRKP